MKQTLLYSTILLLFFSSCKDKQQLKIETIKPVDTVTLSGLPFESITTIFPAKENDSILISSTKRGDTLFVLKLNNNKSYEIINKIATNFNVKAQVFSSNGNIFYFRSDRQILTFDTSNHKTEIYPITEEMPMLKNKFLLAGNWGDPVCFFSDTIVSTFYYDGIASYYNYILDSCFVMYHLDGNNINQIKAFGTKPQSIKDKYFPLLKYCIEDKKLYTIFPSIDSLYIYDLNTSKHITKHINNNYYKVPQAYEIEKMMDQEYQTKYNLENFYYDGIYFNKKTQHFILLYYAPYLSNELIYPAKMYALILDKDFNKKNYYDLGNIYSMPIFSNNGLGIVVYNPNEHERNIKVHIYNF